MRYQLASLLKAIRNRPPGINDGCDLFVSKQDDDNNDDNDDDKKCSGADLPWNLLCLPIQVDLALQEVPGTQDDLCPQLVPSPQFCPKRNHTK